MTGVILSGGENLRMPVLKGFLKVGGRPIIERSLGVLMEIFGRAVISANMPEKYFRFGVPLIGDLKKERGPMTGILSALIATGEESVFVVACDMPFISAELIRYMVDKYRIQDTEFRSQKSAKSKIPNSRRSSENLKSKIIRYYAVIPVFNNRPEPLFGIYTRSGIDIMDSAIADGQRGIYKLLESMNVLFISEEEVRGIEPEGKSFVNINTVADYENTGGELCLV